MNKIKKKHILYLQIFIAPAFRVVLIKFVIITFMHYKAMFNVGNKLHLFVTSFCGLKKSFVSPLVEMVYGTVSELSSAPIVCKNVHFVVSNFCFKHCLKTRLLSGLFYCTPVFFTH